VQELDVQVGGGGELAGAQRRDQRRAQGVVEHRGQEAALDHPGRVQELVAGGERHLDRPGRRVDGYQFPAEQDRGRGRRDPALHHIPERPFHGHQATSWASSVRTATVSGWEGPRTRERSAITWR
jgi:hypothetical protein